MDIFGIIKNLKSNLSLKKQINHEEKIIKEINIQEEDLYKIKLSPLDGEDVFIVDEESDKLLDEWFLKEGSDIDSKIEITGAPLSPDVEEVDPYKTEELFSNGFKQAGNLDSSSSGETSLDDNFDPDKTEELFPKIPGSFGFMPAGDLDATLPPMGNADSGEKSQGSVSGWDDIEWEVPTNTPASAPASTSTTPIVNIPYEPQLGTSTLGMFQAGFQTPDPIDVDESILDLSVKELEGMPIQSLRTLLVDELEALEDVDPKKRNVQLQKIFNHLVRIQPSETMSSTSTDDFLNHEQRLYIDLISTPEIYQMPFVREFLENDFFVGSLEHSKKRLLLDIYKYYDTHSQEAIEKFNYILRSSDAIGVTLLKNDIELEDFFSERVMSSFSKEDLSQLFRFYFCGEYDRKNIQTLFSHEHRKALFMISQMTKKVNSLTGHSSEFLEGAIEMFVTNFGYNGFVTLLNDIYDKVVGVEEHEAKFANAFAATDDFIVMKELINFVVLKKYDGSLSTKLFDEATTLDAFLMGASHYREINHKYVLGEIGLTKLKAGTFDPETDFRPIDSLKALKQFKEGMLYNIYGISLEEAKHLHEHYCRHMEALEAGIIEADRPILEMLKAIDSIYTLNGKDPDLQDKLKVLQSAYYKEISEKGLNHQRATASALIVEGLLNRMFMNTYNCRLSKATNESKVIGYEDGVTILDAGLEFDMIVTSLYGVSDYYDHDVNMASKWNTAALSRGQGFCASHLSSQNLGVISLDRPILGFNQIPQDGLNSMGTSDIYTGFNYYNLRQKNDSRGGSNRFFVPGNIMANEQRYGYNEILLDRFLMTDEEGKLKLQPDYILFYKLNDDYKYSTLYLQSKKMAEDFGIPIMMVDVPKLKAHEKETLLKMEDELFSEEFSEDKFKQIVTRYMNNYTGSLILSPYGMEEDFSVGEMRRFFNKVIKHIEKMEDPDLRTRWVEALQDAYKDEHRKYKEAKSVGGWHYSVGKFIFEEKYNLAARIGALGSGKAFDPEKTEELDPLAVTAPPAKLEAHSLPKVSYNGENYVFASSESMTVEAKAVVDLANYLALGSTFDVVDYTYQDVQGVLLNAKQAEDNETVLVENLLVAYLLGNYEEAPIVEVGDNYGHEIKLDFDIEITHNIGFSSYAGILDPKGDDYIGLQKEKVDLYVAKLEAMSEEKFLKIFAPVIAAQSKRMEESYESIAEKLLDRKASVRDMFKALGEKYGYKPDENGKTDEPNIGDGPKSR